MVVKVIDLYQVLKLRSLKDQKKIKKILLNLIFLKHRYLNPVFMKRMIRVNCFLMILLNRSKVK